MENLYLYVIHDIENHCIGPKPKAIRANSLDDAYYQIYMKENIDDFAYQGPIYKHLPNSGDNLYLSGCDENDNPLPNFDKTKISKEDVVKGMKNVLGLSVIKLSDAIVE